VVDLLDRKKASPAGIRQVPEVARSRLDAFDALSA